MENNEFNESYIIKTYDNKNIYKKLSIFLSIMLFISLGFIGGVLFQKNNTPDTLASNAYTEIIKTASETDGTELTIASIAELTGDSVVEIATETVITSSRMRQYVTEGAGSGVIIRSDGYIVTNNHVIDGASKITVTLKNGESYEAKLIGTDPENDISVIKIDATSLQPVVMGDSDKLKVGDTAIAVGNPLGKLGNTVTSGIISALDREVDLGDTEMNLLQTDAAVNPGNSGGGLFNGTGELIGIVVAKSSGSDVEGIGFAIPVNNIKTIINDLIEHGHVQGRVQIGVSLIDASDIYTAMMYNLNSTGVYIDTVYKASPAEKAGLKSGDKIISFNGTLIDDYSSLKKEIAKCEIGDTVEITVGRGGREKSFNMYLSEYTISE